MDNVPVLKIMYLKNYDLGKWGNMDYTKQGDACFDIRAAIKEPVTLYHMQVKLIPNGFKTEFTSDWVLHIYPRSGLACKHSVTLINCVGTVDSGYRGEVMTGLINFNETPYTINPGDRIAQAALEFIPITRMQTVFELSDSERGEGGIGHTGI